MTAVEHADLTGSGLAMLALAVFVLAYVLVIAEEFTGLRKSKPVVFAAGIIWVLVGIAANLHGGIDAGELIEHNLLEYAGLLLFLLAAMTYVNTLDEAQCVRGAAILDGEARVFTALDLLADRWLGLRAFPGARQPHHRAGPGRRGAECGPRQSAFPGARVHQHRRGCQCRWSLQPLRRHHHADGLAEGPGRASSSSSTFSCRRS